MERAAFGIELFQYLDASTIVADVQRVERLGYASVWLGDAQLLWREMYVLLGAAATATTRITVGAGVTNVATRHVSVTASAMVTLQELSHGRAAVGVGVGGTSTGMVGLPHTSRAQLSQAIEQVAWGPVHPNGRLNVESILDAQRQLVEWGTLSQSVPVDQLVDPQFADYALQQLGPYRG